MTTWRGGDPRRSPAHSSFRSQHPRPPTVHTAFGSSSFSRPPDHRVVLDRIPRSGSEGVLLGGSGWSVGAFEAALIDACGGSTIVHRRACIPQG